MDDRSLQEAARSARCHAYAPYSGFRVGAALAARSGQVYTGCNVENASYGLTICAERVALVKAVSEGERDFTALALVGGGAGMVYPCGACLQALAEFAPRLRVICVDGSGNTGIYSLEELLPKAFVLEAREASDGC
ncbi:MAG: cytidine deaminase [Syntrophomonadaceae bacterium]|nr:cytidine deaminase [Syntrophomonadaceae bacterium]